MTCCDDLPTNPQQLQDPANHPGQQVNGSQDTVISGMAGTYWALPSSLSRFSARPCGQATDLI